MSGSSFNSETIGAREVQEILERAMAEPGLNAMMRMIHVAAHTHDEQVYQASVLSPEGYASQACGLGGSGH